jgi:hypothetical protein
MNETQSLLGILLIIIVVFIVAVIIAAIVTGASSNTSQQSQPPPVSPPPTPPRSESITTTSPPTFRIIITRPGPTSPGVPPPTRPQTRPEWGYYVTHSAKTLGSNGQTKCIVCFDSIFEGYHSAGWVRCSQCKKLAHGHCYTDWLGYGKSGCPHCSSSQNLVRIHLPLEGKTE